MLLHQKHADQRKQIEIKLGSKLKEQEDLCKQLADEKKSMHKSKVKLRVKVYIHK